METNLSPAPRTPLSYEVDFRKSYARESQKGLIRNISLTGAYIELEKDLLAPGEKISLVLIVSGRERVVHANVIWANETGAGLKFKPQNNRDVQIVDDLIYFAESSRSTNKSVFDQIIKKVS